MPRTTVKRAAKRAIVAPPDRFVVLDFRVGIRVKWQEVYGDEGGLKRRPWKNHVRVFTNAVVAFRFAQTIADEQYCRTWIEGRAAPVSPGRSP